MYGGASPRVRVYYKFSYFMRKVSLLSFVCHFACQDIVITHRTAKNI
jgi:hypothetical protein